MRTGAANLSRRAFLGGAAATAVGGANFFSQTGTIGKFGTHAPDEFDYSGDQDGFFPVTRLRQQYLDYLAAKVLEYEEQKQSRHYYHGAHWSPDEIEALRRRRQPIVTFNQIARKIDGIGGLLQRLRQDPKAWPRNPRNAEGAEVATQAIRSVLDGCEWEFLDAYCTVQAGIEGIAGIELKLVEGDHDDPDITADFVFGDDFFYDPRSFKPDFADARYMGIAKWLDLEAAIELFPGHEDQLRTLMVETGFDLTTHADREYKWVYVNEQRIRLVEHWYKHRGKWYWAFYCSMILLDQGVSPFLDERKRPMNRFIMWSANVDHDGDRYGFVRNLKGPQDEVNQRRSKALHISNNTRLTMEKGAVDNVEVTRREAARPDGVVIYNKGFARPEEQQKQENLQAHLALMQDARQEIASFANINPALMAQNDKDEHSGVAINLLQKAGIAEIGSFVRNYKAWKKRVYRGIWNAIQHTWKGERWVRVTDNDGVKQFIQLNGMERGQWGQPTIVNAVGSLDVDIIIDEGPDTANLMQDAYEVIKDDPTIPWMVKLEFMPLPASFKKSIMAKIAEQQQQQQGQDPKAKTEMLKGQIAAAKGKVEVQKANLGAQAEVFNARQDAMARQQDAQLQREKAEAEREKMRLEMAVARMEMERERRAHLYRMRELEAAHTSRMAQEEARRRESNASAMRNRGNRAGKSVKRAA